MKDNIVKDKLVKKNNSQFSILNSQLIILLLLPCMVFAQDRDHRNRQVDSLETILATNPPEGLELAGVYNALIWGYVYTDRDKSMEYARKRIALCIPIDEWGNVSGSFRLLGVLHYDVSQYDSAMVYFNHALEAAEKMRDFPKKYTERSIDNAFSTIYGSIGNLYNMQGKSHEAINYYHKALKLFEKHDWRQSQCEAYHNIGEMYRTMGNYHQAEVNYLKYDSIAHLVGDDSLYYGAKANYCFTNLYFNVQDYDKALHHAELAYDYFFLQPEEVLYQLRMLNNLADIYLEGFKDKITAEKYMQRAIQMNDTLDLPQEKAITLRIVSTLHLHRGEWSQAIQTALNALATGESEPDNTLTLYSLLAKSYAHLGNAGKASEYIDKLNELQSTWSTKFYQSALSEMEVKYETDKKEFEIERQQNIITRQNMQAWLLTASISVCVVILVLLWYMLRLRTRRNYVLAEMNATKDKFFSIISHDLKNPALAQRDALQMLVKSAHLWDTDTLADYHDELLKSAEGQVELIFNLLSWAKLQTGRITFAPETFIFSDLLPNLMLIRKMAENKNITLKVNIPENTLFTADSNILSTVIRNLMTNAIKFTPTNGTVILDVSPSDGDGACPVSTGYIVSVTDTGMGMTEEQKSNLFSMDSTHFRKGTIGEEGSGLGLIVCKELLEKHGSVLYVESEEGKGSRFWFEVKGND